MRIWPTPPLFLTLALLIGVSLSFSNELNAQTTASGALAGVVTDQSMAVIAEAEIDIRDEARGTTQFTRTDQRGEYRFFFLAPGAYTLTARHVGFREIRRTVNVLLGPAVSVNLTLEIAKATTKVTVSDEAPLIHAENGDASTSVTQQQISEVPNPGNDLTYIVQTTPGVVMNTDGPNSSGMNFSILGMPSTSYLYSIDGVDNPPTGALGLLLGQNQVQEATVVSTGYSGQFGNAAGGNINYVTKSGSNQFHGNAQYYWNGRVFNANDWFNNALGYPRPFDIANQWAVSFGGPIRKDKLFFFFDTEGLRVTIPSVSQVLIPSPQFEEATLANIDSRFGAGSPSHVFYEKVFNLYNAAPGGSSAIPGDFVEGNLGCAGLRISLGNGIPCVMHYLFSVSAPSQDALIAERVDWYPGTSDRVFFRVLTDASHTTALANPISRTFDRKSSQTWWQGQAIATHTFGRSAASQILFAWANIDWKFGADDPSKAITALPTVLSFQPPEQFNELGDSSQFRGAVVQYQISGDFVKVGRSHKFGIGVNFDRSKSNFFASPDVGLLIPITMDAFYQGGRDPNFPGTDFTQLSQSFQSATSYPTAFYHLGVYGQDEWHALPGLTLTIALRTEHQSNMVCETRCFARFPGPFNAASHDPDQPYNQAILINQRRAFQGLDNILWSPRFSFAWQPFGTKNNTVLRGGFGVFYDSVDGVASNFSNNPPLLNGFTVTGDVLSFGEQNSLFEVAKNSNKAFVNAFGAGATLAQIQQNVPNFFPPSLLVAEKHTQEPQYQRWSLQLQKAFGTHTSISIGYFGHHGIHELVQNLNANAWGFGSLPAGRCNDAIPDCSPDPRFSAVTELDTKAISNYHGLVVSAQHRLRGRGDGLLQANYTYSHALDEVSNGGTAPFSNWARQPFTVFPVDPNNLRASYGPADYDVRHSFNASYVWEVPVKAMAGGQGPDFLVKGWQVSGTIFARTGLPYTVLDVLPPPDLIQKNYLAVLYGVPVRPLGSNSTCGRDAAGPLALRPCLPTETLADGVTPGPDALFVQPGCETGFNSGHLGPSGVCDGAAVSFSQDRNHFRGPHYFNTDFAIMKKTKLAGWENATLGIGFQFFNFLNHPNFGFPTTGLGTPTGLIWYLAQPPTSLLGTGPNWAPIDVAPRMIQLKAELKF